MIAFEEGVHYAEFWERLGGIGVGIPSYVSLLQEQQTKLQLWKQQLPDIPWRVVYPRVYLCRFIHNVFTVS
jgi:hypothetical protein